MRLTAALLLCGAMATAATDWSGVDHIVSAAIEDRAFAGAVAIVGDASGLRYAKAFGNYTYGEPPVGCVELTTKWDMASCTKVVATTTAVALLNQWKLLGLDERISADHLLGAAFAANGKADITVLNCLLHNAGFPPDPSPNYWDPAFGCAGAPLPPTESFACSQRIYASLLEQTLANGVGETYVYSDLSMITLMFVVGQVVRSHGLVSPADLAPSCAASGPAAELQCFYEAFVRTKVLLPLGMDDSGFLPDPSAWPRCSPTAVPSGENASTVLQGRVNDGNAYMLGGISGHAGLFATGPDLAKFMDMYMFDKGPAGAGSLLLPSTKALFTREYNHSQSSRALGWNTNDPTVFDEGWGGACGNLSARTYMHLGYTGTMICGDPERGVYTILLTNRVYPTDKNTKIQQVRIDFSNAVVAALDQTKGAPGAKRESPDLAV